nr:MAG TPA: hypothetical protein [Caudoviricetes sp.]
MEHVCQIVWQIDSISDWDSPIFTRISHLPIHHFINRIVIWKDLIYSEFS